MKCINLLIMIIIQLYISININTWNIFLFHFPLIFFNNILYVMVDLHNNFPFYSEIIINFKKKLSLNINRI